MRSQGGGLRGPGSNRGVPTWRGWAGGTKPWGWRLRQRRARAAQVQGHQTGRSLSLT